MPVRVVAPEDGTRSGEEWHDADRVQDGGVERVRRLRGRPALRLLGRPASAQRPGGRLAPHRRYAAPPAWRVGAASGSSSSSRSAASSSRALLLRERDAATARISAARLLRPSHAADLPPLLRHPRACTSLLTLGTGRRDTAAGQRLRRQPAELPHVHQQLVRRSSAGSRCHLLLRLVPGHGGAVLPVLATAARSLLLALGQGRRTLGWPWPRSRSSLVLDAADHRCDPVRRRSSGTRRSWSSLATPILAGVGPGVWCCTAVAASWLAAPLLRRQVVVGAAARARARPDRLSTPT